MISTILYRNVFQLILRNFLFLDTSSHLTVSFITARVRSTTGRYCFHRCVCSHLREGGTPILPVGGYPIQPMGGLPHLADGGYPGMGVTPPPMQTWNTPIQTWEVGSPHPDLGWGTPPPTPSRPGKGVPPPPSRPGMGFRSGPRTRGGYPQPEQHSVYLLRSGRYTSCVHAGGLSC